MINTSFGKGWRTVAVNLITLVVVCLGALTGQITDPNTLRYIAIALAIGNTVLRFLTDTPVGGEKGPGA